MFSISDLFNFFTTPYTSAYQSYSGYQTGYETASTFQLLQKNIRVRSITENRIYDFIQVENDPNFGRYSKSSGSSSGGGGGFLGSLFSKLGLSTSLVTILNSKLYMSRISEFIPANIRNLIQNFQSLADTGTNLYNILRSKDLFKQIETALLSDLQIQFGKNIITFSQVQQMYDVISNGQQFLEDIKNNGLRPLLSLGLQNFLPESMLNIFETAQWLDYIAYIFEDDEAEQQLFTEIVRGEVQTYQQTAQIADIVTVEKYQTSVIDVHDPMGIIIKEEFRQEVENDYIETLTEIVESVGTQYNLTEEQKEELLEILVENATTNIDNALKGKTGLPTLTECIKGVEVNVYNLTLSAIKSAFQRFANELIFELGFNPAPANERPLDYLANLKRNINKRIEMKQRGDTSEAFVEIDNYLRSVIRDQEYTEQLIEQLNDRINLLLTERAGVTIAR